MFYQVETFGSMEKKEKVEFILEQMRLCIAKKDYIRTQIISKKINTKFFEDPGTAITVSTVHSDIVEYGQQIAKALQLSILQIKRYLCKHLIWF